MKKTVSVQVSTLNDLSHEATQLQCVVQLAALAGEAVRVLTAVDGACERDPALAENLSSHIAARRQWVEYDAAHIGLVLGHAGQRLEALADRIGALQKGGAA